MAKSPEMDPGIWSRLPEEILEQVLSFLPLKTFLELRSTCKHFKSLIYSPSFISKHYSSSSSSSSPSFLLLSHPQFHHHCHLYDTLINTWRNLFLSLSSIQSCASSSTLLSASNGLLCFSLPNSSFLVCNRLSRSSRIIKFPSRPFSFHLLTLVSNRTGFKLFMLSSTSGSSNCVLVYDSRFNQWQQFDGFNPLFVDNYRLQGVCYNAQLYFATPEPFSIVCFDLESGNWERLMTELPTQLTFVRLVSSGSGNLYLLGGIGRNGISRSVILWELREGKWVEVERVPQMMCKKFMSVCYHNYEHVYCFWHQGIICVCCYTWPEILYYKVSRKTWHWLPKCPSLPDKWSCGFKWFSFVPQLYPYI